MITTFLSNLDAILLVVFALGALIGAVLMLVITQPIRVAMALISTMVFLGGIYGLLGVHYIAAFQVLIYVGAVMVFMVYAIMLLDPGDAAARRYSAWRWPGAVGLLVLLGVLAASTLNDLPPAVRETAITGFGLSDFAASFLNEYWLHFELTSVLLVAAVVAALAVIKAGGDKNG